LRARYLRGGL